MATYTERLAKVQGAIDSILETGQSIQDDGATWTRADLGKLQAMEKSYQIKANREARKAAGKKGRSRVRYPVPQ